MVLPLLGKMNVEINRTNPVVKCLVRASDRNCFPYKCPVTDLCCVCLPYTAGSPTLFPHVCFHQKTISKKFHLNKASNIVGLSALNRLNKYFNNLTNNLSTYCVPSYPL